MAGIDASLSNCKVYIYPGDHNPPALPPKGPQFEGFRGYHELGGYRGEGVKEGLGRSQRVGRKARKSGRISIGVEKAQ